MLTCLIHRVVKAALDMFAKFAAGDQKAIHPNIRGSVYAIALDNGGEKEVRITHGIINLEIWG